MKYDVFISHASEDKDDFVRPLARMLERKGLSVWYDESTLKIGDSITQSINSGLANSSYGIVVISKHFISKKWTQRELGALFARDDAENKKILPIWHNITAEEIKTSYPLLADILAAQSTEGMDTVVRRILEVVNPKLTRQKAKSISRLADLSATIEYFVETSLRNATDETSNAREIANQAKDSISILTKALKDIDKTGDIDEVRLSLIKAEQLITDTISMYCVKCKTNRNKIINVQRIILKNGRPALQGTCPECGSTLFKIENFNTSGFWNLFNKKDDDSEQDQHL